jgi:hypothetical protein
MLGVPITEEVFDGVGAARKFCPTGRVAAGGAVVIVIAVGASFKAWLSPVTSGQETVAQVGQRHLPVALS